MPVRAGLGVTRVTTGGQANEILILGFYISGKIACCGLKIEVTFRQTATVGTVKDGMDGSGKATIGQRAVYLLGLCAIRHVQRSTCTYCYFICFSYHLVRAFLINKVQISQCGCKLSHIHYQQSQVASPKNSGP